MSNDTRRTYSNLTSAKVKKFTNEQLVSIAMSVDYVLDQLSFCEEDEKAFEKAKELIKSELLSRMSIDPSV